MIYTQISISINLYLSINLCFTSVFPSLDDVTDVSNTKHAFTKYHPNDMNFGEQADYHIDDDSHPIGNLWRSLEEMCL